MSLYSASERALDTAVFSKCHVKDKLGTVCDSRMIWFAKVDNTDRKAGPPFFSSKVGKQTE